MMTSMKMASLSAAALLVAASSASAQYTADFEAPDYTLGQLDGQQGWAGWGGINTAFANVVNTQNHTGGGSQSVELASGCDSVRDFAGAFTSGAWIITGWIYAPAAFVGKTYFIVLNEYTDPGPWEWSVQMGFNGNTGMMECDCGTAVSTDRPLRTDVWFDIQFHVDLDLDSVTVYYDTAIDPTPISTYPWSAGVFGTDAFATTAIDAFDLFPDPGTTPTVLYMDDLSIEPAGPQPTGTAICFGDGNDAPCGCGTAIAGTTGGCGNSLNLGATLSATGTPDTTADDVVLSCANVRTQPGLFFQANNTIGGGTGITFGDGIRCCGQSVIRLEVVVPPGPEPATATMGVNINADFPGTITPGDKKCYQFWYRDPGGGNPCGGGNFNLSNAVSITWS